MARGPRAARGRAVRSTHTSVATSATTDEQRRDRCEVRGPCRTAGPIVPPREFGGVGVAITGEVGEPEFEQPLDGVAFGWAGVGRRRQRRVVDITISGGDVDVAGHDRAPSAAGAAEVRRGAFEPHEFVEVVRIVECSPVGNIDRPAPDAPAGRGDETGLIERAETEPLKPRCTSSMPTRLAIATPFQWSTPW